MATDKQRAANKLNAQKCTGPNTPEGKARSSQNALKTGLDAKSIVIRTEKQADLETLTAEYFERYQPTSPEERRLVDMLVSSEWLGRRYLTADAAIWERRFDETECDLMGKVFMQRADIFIRVDRRINSAHRNFLSALTQLQSLQSGRVNAFQPDLSQPDQPDLPAAVQPDIPAPDCDSSLSQGAAAPTEEPIQSPSPDAATEPLNPELVSIAISIPPAPPQPGEPDKDGQQPPIAA